MSLLKTKINELDRKQYSVIVESEIIFLWFSFFCISSRQHSIFYSFEIFFSILLFSLFFSGIGFQEVLEVEQEEVELKNTFLTLQTNQLLQSFNHLKGLRLSTFVQSGFGK